ncbi:MAG: Hsp70 family protein [Oscillospiraceae bacterium]|nr:Hsp70 family protein [Oscillospiraceae bacterium]
MTLKEWLGIRAFDINEGDTADVFAQLLAYLDKSGAVFADPADISIDDGELVFRRSYGFDENYRPIKAEDAPCDAVFAAGIMLYHKLSGELPDMANTALLLLGARSDNSVSLCSCPSTSADGIIKAMTRILPENRISAYQALDMLAQYRSKARIDYTEEETGTVLFSEEIPLDSAVTVYVPTKKETDTAEIFPGCEKIEIPYRRVIKSYICPVSLTESAPCEHRERHTEGRIFAFDAGSHLRAALFDTDGTLSDIADVPLHGGEDISCLSQRILSENGYDAAKDRIAATDRTALRADATVPFGSALGVYQTERPSLFACLGSEAHICAYGIEESCVTVPLGKKMSEIMTKDMLSTLRISYHVDLSDEVLHRDALDKIRMAADDMIKKLSFSPSAENSAEIMYNGEMRHFDFAYDRYRFENMVRDIITDLISAVDEALNTAKTSREELRATAVSGGAACMPCLRAVFETENVETVYIRRHTAARGCAVRADMPTSVNDAVGFDIGVLSIPINSSMPVFSTLIKAGTPKSDCRFTYSSEGLRPEEKDGRKQLILKIYKRKKGMEHVKSPYDPEGSAIAYLGRVTADIPNGMDDDDRIVFTVMTDGVNLSASAEAHRRKGTVGRLLGRITGADEWEKPQEIRTEVR